MPDPTERGRRRWIRSALVSAVVAFVLLNAAAARHAWTMTNFVPREPGAEPPLRPEQLSLGAKLALLVTGLDVPRPENTLDPGDEGLPFETKHFASDDGTRLSAWFVPRPDPRGVVVLLHGYTGRADCVIGEARWFHDGGFACLLVDFRGSGGSEGSTTTLGWYEADDVAAAVELAHELVAAPVVVYGQSMGAVAAMRALAGGRAATDALIVESPYPTLLATIEKRFDLMGLPSFPAAEVLAFWGGRLHDFDPFALRPLDDAARIDAPTLLLTGALDTRVLEAEARAVFDAFPGDKQFHVFAEAGHAPIRSAAPDEWRDVVGRFLDRL
jgi:hypothetical protein